MRVDRKFLTSPATCEGNAEQSNLVILPMPDWPLMILAHDSATPIPTGVIKPKPVTTTLLFDMDLIQPFQYLGKG